MAMGWFGGDIVDAVADVATSAFDRIPGSSALSEAVSDVWTGPLRDFAKTPIGVTVLTAVASAAYGPLAYALGGPYGLANFGAQIATVTWALPGVAKGDDFGDAWVSEVKRRAEKTAEAVGGEAASAAIAHIGIATDFLKSIDPGVLDTLESMPEELLSETVKTLAAEAGVEDWSIAMALDGMFGWFPGPPDWGGVFSFDDVTGEMISTRGARDVKGWYGDLAAQYYGHDVPAASTFDPTAIGGERSVIASTPSADVTPLVMAATGGAPDSPRKRAGDVMLGVVILAAVGAVWYWKKNT